MALSITAFPVLARILSELQVQQHPLGVFALTCAAISDVTAWCLLAVVVGILQSSPDAAIRTTIFTICFLVMMFYVVKPIFARLIPWLERSSETVSEGSLSLILICLLISALATEMIGIHALFGGFLLGAILPHESRIAGDITTRIQDLVRVFFLPAFFAFTGLRTEIGLLHSGEDWVLAAVVIVFATLGKFGGTYLAARLSRVAPRPALALGFMMNTRGLVELIILNVGLDLGVLSPRLFAIFVMMALVTTLMTTPLLKLLKVEKLNAQIIPP